jgi:hypothetical protein
LTEKHINYKAKKLIFDRSEDQFYLFKEEIYITDTNEQVNYQNSVAKPIWEADDELKIYITKNINGIKKIEYKFDPTPSYKHDNLDIYFQKVSSKKNRERNNNDNCRWRNPTCKIQNKVTWVNI